MFFVFVFFPLDTHLAPSVPDMMVPFGVREMEMEPVEAGVAEFALHGGGVGAEIEQRAEDHVAGGAHHGFEGNVGHGVAPRSQRSEV